MLEDRNIPGFRDLTTTDPLRRGGRVDNDNEQSETLKEPLQRSFRRWKNQRVDAKGVEFIPLTIQGTTVLWQRE